MASMADTDSLALSRRARLDQFKRVGFCRLSPTEQLEAETLVDQDVLDWCAELAAQLKSDVDSRRFTKRWLAATIGITESYMGKAMADPEKMSPRIVARLSMMIPGYESAYAELRSRADQLWLTESAPVFPASQNLLTDLQLFREAVVPMQAALPALMRQLDILAAAAAKGGGHD
jgi:hypothetical protein